MNLLNSIVSSSFELYFVSYFLMNLSLWVTIVLYNDNLLWKLFLSAGEIEREGESKQKVLVFVVLTTVLTKVGQHWVQA
jgi:hypothetical protein